MSRELAFDPSAPDAKETLYDLLTTAAEHHGLDSEGWPTTVGDLEVALSTCLDVMSPEQLQTVFDKLREDIADNHHDYDAT